MQAIIMQLLSHPRDCDNRFYYLLIALTILLLGYPYWGKVAGGLITLAMLAPGMYAVHTNRRIFTGACILAIITAVVSITMMVRGETGHPLVEGSFFLFFAFITISIFIEIMRTREFMADTLSGAVSVYLLIGISFGQLYDLVETLHPGSFTAGLLDDGSSPGWTLLIFYSFMTLTTVGYGDISPATDATRSLAILESTIGVLYVAILIARLIGSATTNPET
jgi:hypothetical protein